MAGWRGGGVLGWGGGEERKKRQRKKKKRARVALYEKNELTDKKQRHWLVVSVVMGDGKLKFPRARHSTFASFVYCSDKPTKNARGVYISGSGNFILKECLHNRRSHALQPPAQQQIRKLVSICGMQRGCMAIQMQSDMLKCL